MRYAVLLLEVPDVTDLLPLAETVQTLTVTRPDGKRVRVRGIMSVRRTTGTAGVIYLDEESTR